MLLIRKAREKDRAEIADLRRELDLFNPTELTGNFRLDNFWVAEKEGKVAGIVGLEENKDFFFLSSLGVIASQRGKRIAAFLVKETTKAIKDKPIYLYTIIPEFFGKLGFEIVSSPPPYLPPRGSFGCKDCIIEKCVCMIKSPGGPRIS